MSSPRWDDIYSLEQLVEQVQEIGERLARKHGAYSDAADLKLAAECIEEQAEIIAKLKAAGDTLAREVKASIEAMP